MRKKDTKEARMKTDFPQIKVTTPCDCGQRWFSCRHRKLVAVYQCHRDLDGTGMVHPDDAEQVAKQHPGMDLIYL